MSSSETDPFSRRRKRGRDSRVGPLLRAVFVAAVAVATLAAPRAALAKKRIVVLEFHGPGSRRLQREVAHILHRRAALVSARRFHHAARRLHARRPTSHNVARIARRLSVDGVVVGLIRRHHHRYRLILVLRAGKNGRIARRLTLTLRHPRLDRHARRRIEHVLERGISFLPSVSSGGHESANADSGDDMGNNDQGDQSSANDNADNGDNDNAGNDNGDNGDNGADNGNDNGGGEVPPDLKSKNKKDSDSGDSGDSGGGDASASVTAKAGAGAGHRAAELSAGVDFVNRNLSFTSVAGLMNKPQNYQGSTVPAVLVSAELYPAAAFGKPSKSWTHKVGVSAVVDKVISISSHVQGMTQSLPTSQTRFGVGLFYRWDFGSSPTSPSIKVGAGYNSLAFTIDKSKSTVNVDVPNVSYQYIDPGVKIRYPVNPKLALTADARFLGIFATGEVQKASQYGAATMTGFHVAVGAEYKLNPRLLLQAGGRWTGISYSFKGNGDLAVNRDGNPKTLDVTGASDRYLAGYATVGYMF